MCRCIKIPDNFTIHNETTEKATLERASRSHLVHSSAPGQGHLDLSDWCLSNGWLKAFKTCPGSLSQHCTVFANAKCFFTSKLNLQSCTWCPFLLALTPWTWRTDLPLSQQIHTAAVISPFMTLCSKLNSPRLFQFWSSTLAQLWCLPRLVSPVTALSCTE